jgi:hypothetical protein
MTIAGSVSCGLVLQSSSSVRPRSAALQCLVEEGAEAGFERLTAEGLGTGAKRKPIESQNIQGVNGSLHGIRCRLAEDDTGFT